MPNPMEGLCYVLETDGSNPEQKFREFVDFCKNGIRNAAGGFELEDGREIRGVIDWLVNLPVDEANFFAADRRVEGTIFVATLSLNGVPWITIPGFMRFVKIVSTSNLADHDGQIKLTSQTSLDDEFRKRAAGRRLALALLSPVDAEGFAQDLGKTDVPRQQALSRLDESIRSQVAALLS